MSFDRPDSLLAYADIVILVLVLALTTHMVIKERENPRLASSGRILLLAGIFLAAFANFAERFAPIPVDATGIVLGANDAPPEWMYWVAMRAAVLLAIVGLYLAFMQRLQMERRASETSAAARAAESQALLSEERFRSLFETQSAAVYCYSFEPPVPVSSPPEAQIEASLNAVLTKCNDVFARSMEHESANELLGTPMSLLDSTKDEASHARFMRDLIAANYKLTDYELIYKGPGGDDRAISMSITGIVRDGCLVRFWGVERNILDLRQTKSALYRRRVFQEMLATISTRLLKAPYQNADEVMLQSLQEVCLYNGGNRTTLSWIDMTNRTGEVLYTWHKSNAEMIFDFDAEKFPFFSELLIRGESLIVNDVSLLPDEAATDRDCLVGAGMKSLLFYPMQIAGEVVGVLTMGNDVEYCNWSERELTDFQVFGELFANFILRVRQRRALDAALEGLHKATERLEAENVYLRTEIKLNHDFEEIVGESDVLRRSLQMVEQVADTMTPVLILGETGTGKELIARALHEHSSRRHRPLVKVNCAALPANLIESELFGYEKGAFTSADSFKRGRFDLAHGSTLFLDEIGEIPFELQAKLLRVLQEGEFERLGGSKTVKVDIRIIAATNRDLWQACEDGEFRSDLYYRINTFPIELPSLRDRGGDIRLLAEYFAHMHAQRLGREITAISAKMMKRLESYDWPGNVRELEGIIQRSLLSTTGPILELAQSLADRKNGIDADDVPTYQLKSVERDHIVSILEECRWKIAGRAGAASALGIPPSTLRSKMKKLGISRPA
ncbi:MAG: sigma 54-interacting transcriptional regulator [Woeseiaceae bacterium]|nr:sigma 54-interacting transcriptional regulator [Woeseiaceae bacterium]